MTHFSDANAALAAAFWLTMVPIAAFVLIKVNGFFIDDFPTTFFRAMGLVLVTAVVMFFAYDLSGYFFARLMQDPEVGVRFPSNYSYLDWLREPVALKWRVLGLFPFVRYIPIGIAVMAGSILNIFVWRIAFPLAFLIVVVQLAFNVLAMAALSFVFRFGIALYEKEMLAERREPAAERRLDPNAEPANLSEMERRVRQVGAAADTAWYRLSRQWDGINDRLAPLYRTLQPVTDHFPPPVQDWLNAGGWVALPVGVAALALLARRYRGKSKHHNHRIR